MRTLLILVILATGFWTHAQNAPDSPGQKVVPAQESSFAANPPLPPLYNGTQHYGYPANYIGHAYWSDPSWKTGSVWYQGVRYDSIFFKYDLITDELIVNHPMELPIAPFKQRVNRFQQGDTAFIYMDTASSLPPGFYQEMEKGFVSVYVKKKKTIVERIVVQELEHSFTASNSFYILKEGTFHPVKNLKSVLNLMEDKRTELQQELNKQRVKFRKNPEQALRVMAKYYNLTADRL